VIFNTWLRDDYRFLEKIFPAQIFPGRRGKLLQRVEEEEFGCGLIIQIRDTYLTRRRFSNGTADKLENGKHDRIGIPGLQGYTPVGNKQHDVSID
jgi:hypothetical protein